MTMEQFRPVKDMGFSEAMKELEAIVRQMQADNCDIDNLTTLTRRATELLAECKQRLTATDTQLQEILQGLI